MKEDLGQLAKELMTGGHAEDRRQRSGVMPKTLADAAMTRLDKRARRG
jgi:hypothetical protein